MAKSPLENPIFQDKTKAVIGWKNSYEGTGVLAAITGS